MVAAPLLAPALSKWLGFGNSLMLAGGISIFGFVLFLLEKKQLLPQEE
jgi:dipeptide/tripeptide permease